MPIRWRLAGGSALLTLVILCGFAGAVGTLTTERIHEDFEDQVANAADELRSQIRIELIPAAGGYRVKYRRPNLDTYVGGSSAAIRVVTEDGQVIKHSRRAPDLGPPLGETVVINGYRVENRILTVESGPLVGRLYVQYGRPAADVDATVRRVRLFLLVGVLSGAGLALLAGLMIARRAMAPIAELTATAREIQRTRDPGLWVPQPEADDEVAELARTLEGMLASLDEAQDETEAALRRQREFVADASHELRTPLTSVLANLELLADTLDGERGDAAQSALRSSRRMRRLVADLLLLARADAARQAPHAPTDLGEVLVEAAAELGALGDTHELRIEPGRAVVDGARDELHRLTLNLMENAIRHTPTGTHVQAAVRCTEDGVELVVEDDGLGIPPGLRDRVFERFVRGEGDRGGSFGLGLSIVRAVTESHGGRVRLESPSLGDRGTRFVVTLPAARRAEREPLAVASA